MTYKIRIDTGGTFTDCRGEDSSGVVRIVKVLSSGRLRLGTGGEKDSSRTFQLIIPESWKTGQGFFTGFTAGNHLDERSVVAGFDEETSTIHLEEPLQTAGWIDLFTGEEAPVIGARLLTGTGITAEFPPLDFRLATTRGTNALLERKGEPLILFINRGFGDLLEIGDQRRPDLFALQHRKPAALYHTVVEVSGRLDRDGKILEPLNLESPELKEQIRELLENGIRTAAISLIHSYENPEQELELKRFLLDCGFSHVSASAELPPLIKLLPRTRTAVVNAYLQPVMQTFLDHVSSSLGEATPVFTMTSAGGLEPSEIYQPKDSLLSGPAGGVAGAAAVAREMGYEKIITFDMGGTSTDVARYDGQFIFRFEQQVGDARLLSTALKIETVASGGGSICQWSESGLRVGPESAGADPGPACYGRGGPLTITDVNLLLQRIDPANFGIPLTSEQVAVARERALELQGKAGLSNEEIDCAFLEGLIDIAVEQMADAIRTISIRDGADPSEYALLAFGGAGPLHACAIAEKLEMETVIIPGEAGILSAYGLDRSAIERIAEVQVNAPLEGPEAAHEALTEVTEKVQTLFSQIDREVDQIRFIAEVRMDGQDSALSIDFDSIDHLPEAFRKRYEDIFGYAVPAGRSLEIVSIRGVGSTGLEQSNPGSRNPDSPKRTTSPEDYLLARNQLPVQASIEGPRVVQDPYSTLYLAENWNAVRKENDSLILTRVTSRKNSPDDKPEQILLELFRHRFEQIVEEMGAMLEHSAISTNVKERLDFSCALLDGEGKLVASANHIPVHLGALGMCVRMVREKLEMRPGDTIVTNHPGIGGSHLPDVTLITPVFSPGNDSVPIAYLANRAHHAELGGITPGSMPPAATCLAEEGIVIFPRHLVAQGESKFNEVESLLRTSPWPSRRPADNLADLHAQLAANLRGVSLLEEIVTEHGPENVGQWMLSLEKQSRSALELLLADAGFERGHSIQLLDDGTRIEVSIEKEESHLNIDFTGTSLEHPGNLNATPAIVSSAILYVIRLWTQRSLPLNEGLLDLVTVHLPTCFLNPEFGDDPSSNPAVVGGNVETSQRLVDALIEAIGLQACSQGTMNNLIFGDDSFGYYETIAGGAGAGPGYDGASALHTHMTNTAITDPEILENRYPVRLVRFSIRYHSGGDGEYRGGDGVVRELTFLSPLKVSLLTQHRRERPFGIRGGEPGTCGDQFIDGEPIDGFATHELSAGQCLRIETPGGGGCGTVP